MNRTFRYRLNPTKAQEETLLWTLRRCCELYNGALQERRDHYKKFGKGISVFGQMAELKDVRVVREDFKEVNSQVLQNVLKRLDLSFQAFFRRVKAGGNPGFPRFKPSARYTSFTYPQLMDGKYERGAKLILAGRKVRLSGIGDVKVKLHRPLEGVAKQATVSLAGDGHWYIAFVCTDLLQKLLPATGKSVGLDLGITSFAALSDGTFIENPRLFEASQHKLRLAQRKLAKKKRGSNRRKKAVLTVRKVHAKVSRSRRDFHFKVASKLLSDFDEIAVEDLNVKGLQRGWLSKQVSDVGWGQFVEILVAKAESAGRQVIKVSPNGTSQRCSGCQKEVRKGLHVRVHNCPHCGLSIDRDTNASLNVKRLGLSLRREDLEVGGLNDPRMLVEV